MSRKPFRLRLAQKMCRPLPPLISQRIRTVIYPQKLAFKDDYEFQVRALTGSWFRSRTSDFHGYPFSVHGYYEWRNWAVALAVCSSGDRIVEIGANIGTETVGFADILGIEGRVYAFEPFPDNVRTLQQNIALNNHVHVTVLPLAIAATVGTIKFVCPPDEHASGVGFVTRDDHVGERVIEVESVTLDSLGDRLGKARAIFVDVEGAEIEVLQGARRYIAEVQPIIVLEASPACLERSGHNLSVLHREATKHNYRAFRIGRFGVTDVDLYTQRAGNWLCVPASQTSVVRAVDRMIKRCGFMPCVSSFNPLVGKA